MKRDPILVPVSVLALWTLFVLLLTGLSRIRAVRAGRVSRRAFALGESAEVPADVSLLNRNLMNLLELPVLFYVVCIAFTVTHRAAHGTVVLAWTYVGLRVIHSCVHITYNWVVHRLIVFFASAVVLSTLWVRFLLAP